MKPPIRTTCPHCGASLQFRMLDLDPPDTIVIEPNCPVCGESVPITEEMWTRAQEEGFP